MRQTEGKRNLRDFDAARSGFFAVDVRRRKRMAKIRGRHSFAEKIPQICHAAVRVNSYAAFGRASS